MPSLSLLFALSFAASSPTPTLTVDECSLGEAYSFGHAQCRIRLHNNSERPLSAELHAQNPKDAVSPAVLTVPAKGVAEALVDVDLANTVGRVSRGFRIHPDRGADLFASATGFAMSALDDVRPEVAFGAVELSTKPIERTITLSSRETPQFRILNVLDRPQGVDASIDADGHALHVRLRDDAPLGIVDGDIKLAIDTPRQREAWVHVSAELRGEVGAPDNPYWFGSVPAGNTRTVLIPLMNHAGREFHIGEMRLEMLNGKVDVVPCEQKKAGCKAIRLVLDDSHRAGLTRGKLDIELPDQRRRLALRIWGILQADSSASGSSSPLPTPPTEQISAPWTEGVVDSVNAPVYAVPTVDPLDLVGGPPPASEPPPGTGPLLKWGIASEGGAYGYQIFRADMESGPFLLQNAEVIRVHAKEYANTRYFWRDERAEKGKTYWYYVGVVYKDGRKQVLSAPQSIVAK